MGWFEHRHHWRLKTGLNTIASAMGGDKPSGGLIVEDCSCGAVRTIEFYPGEAPVIRTALTTVKS